MGTWDAPNPQLLPASPLPCHSHDLAPVGRVTSPGGGGGDDVGGSGWVMCNCGDSGGGKMVVVLVGGGSGES